jgi:hypothetical protein
MIRKQSIASLSLGALFGLGLWISGMTEPKKVQDFLDFGGRWDASLVLVLGGAVLVTLVTFPLILRRSQPVIGHKFHLPTAKAVDRKLVVGSALFGVGWGLGGFCPGPALVALGTGSYSALLFVVAMLLGMTLHRTYHDLRQPASRG